MSPTFADIYAGDAIAVWSRGCLPTRTRRGTASRAGSPSHVVITTRPTCDRQSTARGNADVRDVCGWETGSSPGGDALRHAGGQSPQRGLVASRLVRELHGLGRFGQTEQTIRLPYTGREELNVKIGIANVKTFFFPRSEKVRILFSKDVALNGIHFLTTCHMD